MASTRRRWRLIAATAAVMLAVACTNGGTATRTSAVSSAGVSNAAPASTADSAAGSSPSTPDTGDTPASDVLPTLPDLSAPDVAPATETEQLQATLAGTGTPTLAQAIDVFSVSMADMPGASTSTMAAGEGFSATVAMAVIQAHRAELTPAQQAVVDLFDGTVIASTDHAGGSLQPVTPGDTSTSGSTASNRATTPSGTTVSGTTVSGTTLLPTPTGTAPAGTAATSSTPIPTATAPTAPTATAAPTTKTATAAWARPLAALGPAENVELASRLHVGAPTPPPGILHDLDLLNQTLRDWNAREPALIQRPKAFSLAFSTKQPKDNSEMDTGPSPTVPGGCLITMYPIFSGGHYSDALAKYVFAHELFHCIQFSWSHLSDGLEWLTEGSAEFAALDLYRATFQPVDTESFQDWFTNTAVPLGSEPTGRGYSDWALFEAFKQMYNTDPYPAIESMIEAGGPTASRLTAGHFDNPIFASLWTSTSLRSTSFTDPDFQLDWPGVQPGYGKNDTATSFGSQGVGTFKINGKGNFVHQQYQVTFSSKVGLVGVQPKDSPMLTHADAGTVGVGDGLQKWFCVDPGKCQCPAGTSPTRDFVPLTPPMIFSFATQKRTSSAQVVDQPWDPNKYCKPGDDPSSDPGPVGTSNGDPHITTFNGLPYDFMTYGEFVTATDSHGGFTVQERHAKAGFGTAVSAVAVGDGTHRLTFTAASISPTAAIVARADGTVTTQSAFTAGGLSVSAQPDNQDVTVTFPDGSAVRAKWDDGFFITVQPSAARAPHIVGLLGTPGESILGDLLMPDGTRAVPSDNYLAFAKAWWVTDSTSLFDYDSGQNTESFRVTPPTEPVTPPSTQTLNACQQGLGATATNAEIAACAYDLTSLNLPATDQTSIVTAYQQVTAERVADITTSPVTPGPPRITVGDTSGAAPASGSGQVSAPAGAGGSTLTLAGTLRESSGPDVVNLIRGNMTLAAGTVLLARTQCPSDPNFELELRVTSPSDGTTSTGLCGNLWTGEASGAAVNNEAHKGESYILIHDPGTYEVGAEDESASDAEKVIPISVSLFSDPNPTVVPSASLAGAGTTVTLSGPAKTMLIEASPGSKGGSWSITGGAAVCGQVYYDPVPLTGPVSPVDLGPLCWHHTELSLGGFDGVLPIAIFNRSDTPATVTVKQSG